MEQLHVLSYQKDLQKVSKFVRFNNLFHLYFKPNLIFYLFQKIVMNWDFNNENSTCYFMMFLLNTQSAKTDTHDPSQFFKINLGRADDNSFYFWISLDVIGMCNPFFLW